MVASIAIVIVIEIVLAIEILMPVRTGPVRVAVSEVLLQLGHLVELWIIHRLS